eukprot:scaffold75410_cov23-Tisochrysis_lutea.AAC.1
METDSYGDRRLWRQTVMETDSYGDMQSVMETDVYEDRQIWRHADSYGDRKSWRQTDMETCRELWRQTAMETSPSGCARKEKGYMLSSASKGSLAEAGVPKQAWRRGDSQLRPPFLGVQTAGVLRKRPLITLKLTSTKRSLCVIACEAAVTAARRIHAAGRSVCAGVLCSHSNSKSVKCFFCVSGPKSSVIDTFQATAGIHFVLALFAEAQDTRHVLLNRMLTCKDMSDMHIPSRNCCSLKVHSEIVAPSVAGAGCWALAVEAPARLQRQELHARTVHKLLLCALTRFGAGLRALTAEAPARLQGHGMCHIQC